MFCFPCSAVSGGSAGGANRPLSPQQVSPRLAAASLLQAGRRVSGAGAMASPFAAGDRACRGLLILEFIFISLCGLSALASCHVSCHSSPVEHLTVS